MDANKFLYEKQLQCFMAQDPEEGFFDVTFEIDGKKLYADKFRLAAISPTFKTMFAKHFDTNNGQMVIKGNTFEEFKEFLTFIYSGKCNLTPENVFAMVDIAQCYCVEILTKICDDYLTNIEISNENVFQILELGNRYNMNILKKNSLYFIVNNFHALSKSEKFLSLDGLIILQLLVFAENKIKPGDMFESIFKWGEHQAKLKRAESNNVNFNVNEAIKNELKGFLPHIKFRKMKLEYLHKVVVVKAFIFPSLQELSDILCNCVDDAIVKVISPNGTILQGNIRFDDNTLIDFIKSLKNFSSIYNGFSQYFWWSKKCVAPSTPSQLQRKEEIEWYLIYFPDGYIGIKHQSDIHCNDYLLAEMFSVNEVQPSDGWKIEIV